MSCALARRGDTDMATTTAAQSHRLPILDIERGGFLNTRAAAEFLDLSDAWLRLLRARGEGPPYARLGRRVVYKRDDLNAWVERFRVPS
jgi:predicted DNA-binding transcriptional regulator AlpA